jgi:hypothetical protein
LRTPHHRAGQARPTNHAIPTRDNAQPDPAEPLAGPPPKFTAKPLPPPHRASGPGRRCPAPQSSICAPSWKQSSAAACAAAPREGEATPADKAPAHAQPSSIVLSDCTQPKSYLHRANVAGSAVMFGLLTPPAEYHCQLPATLLTAVPDEPPGRPPSHYGTKRLAMTPPPPSRQNSFGSPGCSDACAR